MKDSVFSQVADGSALSLEKAESRASLKKILDLVSILVELFAGDVFLTLN